MPASAQARCLEPTYTTEPGSSPTSTVASPGVRPVPSVNARTRSDTSPRTRAAIALPSMIVAVMALIVRSRTAGCCSEQRMRRPVRHAAQAPPPTSRSAATDRRVLGHQLALGPVTREAHDDHAPGLHTRDDALAEGGVHDVRAH